MIINMQYWTKVIKNIVYVLLIFLGLWRRVRRHVDASLRFEEETTYGKMGLFVQ